MAQTLAIQTVCDYPHDSDVASATTRTITIDGRDYVADLCSPHSFDLDSDLAEFVKHARAIPAQARQKGKVKKRTKGMRDAAAAVRRWWWENPSASASEWQAKGRIPADVKAAYHARAGAR